MKFIFSLIFLFMVSPAQILFAATADLEFSVVLDKTEYKTQDPVNATFKLKNKGKDSVYVNSRFYLNSQEVTPKKRGEVTMEVISPSGKKLPCKFSYETGYPKSDYFVLLEQGKEAASEWPRNLRGYFDFEETGVYKIVAVYENIFGEEIGLNVLKRKLISPEVSFKIIKE